MYEIEHIIADLKLPEKVKKDVIAVYGLIAEAESHAHGVPVSDIHFHEVGTMDAYENALRLGASEKTVAYPLGIWHYLQGKYHDAAYGVSRYLLPCGDRARGTGFLKEICSQEKI